MVRLYAKGVRVSVILIGIVGLLLGHKSLLGVLNIDLAEDGIHLLAVVAAATRAKPARGMVRRLL